MSDKSWKPTYEQGLMMMAAGAALLISVLATIVLPLKLVAVAGFTLMGLGLFALAMHKKNRGKDAGVSPVIAVILMVAITVILAGVAYYWVSNLASTQDVAPTLSLSRSGYTDGNYTFTVTRASLVEYENLTLKVDGDTIPWGHSGIVMAGDMITVPGVPGDVLRVTHTPSNSLILTLTMG